MTKTEELEVAEAILRSRKSIREMFKDSTVEYVDKIIERITIIRDEKIEEEKQAEAERKQKEKAKQEVMDVLAKKGLSIEDFVTPGPGMRAEKKPKSSAPVHLYEFTDEDGKTYQYEGPAVGVINKKAENGERFAEFLKRVKKKRTDFIKA